MTFEYQIWGLAENKGGIETIAIQPLSAAFSQKAVNMINQITDTQSFQIIHSGLVEHYQGKQTHPRKLAWIRLVRQNSKNSGLHGEHISITMDIHTLQVIGFTRMDKQLVGEISISHQTALNQAVIFLKKYAADLMLENTIMPELKPQDLGTKLEFNDKPSIGNIELQWINHHTEEIISNQEKNIITGMKVKMYIPATKLWAWVIVDKSGDILTFERDIFWNFDQFKRETQMWLHDKWIAAHKITFTQSNTEINSCKA